jgi:hypothetical protein
MKSLKEEKRRYFVGVSKAVYDKLVDLAMRNKMTVQQVATAILEGDLGK